jgi:hypothetical protein
MIFGLTLSLQENYYAEVRCVAIIIIAYRTRLLSHLRNRRNLRMVLPTVMMAFVAESTFPGEVPMALSQGF